MVGTGDKLLTAAEIKEVTDTKVDKDFSALTALPNGLSDTDLINVRRSGTNYKLSGSDLAPTPLVVSITTGQWSGTGSDYYITVTASNVTANSVLVPTYDHTSDSRLKGPVWCVPAAGSFTIHTSAIPTGTVTIMVQFIGTLGEAQYQVLADVYSKSQTDSLVAQSTAYKSTHIVNESLSFTTNYAYLNKSFTTTKTAIATLITSYNNSRPTAIGCKVSTSVNGASYIFNSSIDEDSYGAVVATGILSPGTYYLWGKAKSAGNNNVRVTVLELG